MSGVKNDLRSRLEAAAELTDDKELGAMVLEYLELESENQVSEEAVKSPVELEGDPNTVTVEMRYDKATTGFADLSNRIELNSEVEERIHKAMEEYSKSQTLRALFNKDFVLKSRDKWLVLCISPYISQSSYSLETFFI